VKTSLVSEEVAATLDRLRARFGLTPRQGRQLAAILAYLEQEDRAPTAVRDPHLAVRTHLADSLVALELEAVRAACEVVDLGAGAGFPGLPLAVALIGTEVTLLDSQRRKCAFAEGLCRMAEVSNVRVVCARAEEWSDGLCGHDLALARAVAPQSVVLEYAAPLLRLGGTLVDWRGRRDEVEELRASRAAVELGLELLEICRVDPYEQARDHHLHIYSKVLPTPARFPRRAGIARKRPLGC
jgi:16S rRNA (guanine527-N7)-methyltransferase